MDGLELTMAPVPTVEQVAEVVRLLDRVERLTGHPALGEQKRMELTRASGDSAESAVGDGGIGDGLRTGDGLAEPAGTRRRRSFSCVLASRRGSSELVGYAHASATTPSCLTAELVSDPTDRDAAGIDDALLETVIEDVVHRGGGTVRLWTPAASSSDDARSLAHGLTVERNLIQMRCPLPLPLHGGGSDRTRVIRTRPFRPGIDEQGWLEANNRAFAGHPEQGHWDLATLLEREDEPWFDPAGLLMIEHDGGRIAGSCWTKIHRGADPPLGEIYVIGVDPDYHGRGWGRALLVAGLDWLAQAGLTVGMLYVDADNSAAIALYRSMGFTDHHIDRAYSGSFEGRGG